MEVAIVKYNAGNIYSVESAIRRLGIEPCLTDDANKLRSADCVLFPGQGEASGAMKYLCERQLDKVICDLRQPVLGICIGQQLMCKHSEEGDTECLGIFDTEVKRFRPEKHEDKIPAMGWNELILSQNEDNRLLKNLGNRPYVYFVHSYYVPICKDTIAEANYIENYSACLHKDNFYTCQFHPEKSGKVGEQILRNFIDIINQR